mmetsp:Transcript_34670/g.85311  ORF Transcript_34670/g.85311 Transcript_34670/m.85311 type:complete len:240 (+) Transcript_34670:511-1230(+)
MIVSRREKGVTGAPSIYFVCRAALRARPRTYLLTIAAYRPISGDMSVACHVAGGGAVRTPSYISAAWRAHPSAMLAFPHIENGAREGRHTCAHAARARQPHASRIFSPHTHHTHTHSLHTTICTPRTPRAPPREGGGAGIEQQRTSTSTRAHALPITQLTPYRAGVGARDSRVQLLMVLLSASMFLIAARTSALPSPRARSQSASGTKSRSLSFRRSRWAAAISTAMATSEGGRSAHVK